MKHLLFCSLLAATPVSLQAAPAATVSPLARMEVAVAAQEKRAELLRSEIKAADARIEARVDSLVTALSPIGDSKDSNTKVTRMKAQTIEALRKNISYYQGKRATLVEELRQPKLQLTEEQKRRGIQIFDEHCEKRVAQILQLQKSLPTEKDYARYKATGESWGGGTNYAVNEDYRQNKKVSAVTNAQRKSVSDGLRKSIERLEDQNRKLKGSNGPADEIAKNDALITERRKQLAVALAPVETPTRVIGGKEAADLDKALSTSIADLRGEFTTLFADYHTLIQELSTLNKSRAALAAAKAKPKVP